MPRSNTWLLLLALLAPLLAHAGAQPGDAGPSDEEVARIYAAARGRKVGTAELCIQRATTLPVVAVGTQAGFDDPEKPFGCVLDGVLVHGSLMDAGQGARVVLGQLGWDKASGPKRAALALRWTREVQLAFEPVLRKLAGVPARRIAFTPPRAAPAPGGGVVVTVVSQPPYSGPYDIYRKWQLRFGPDGALVEAKRLRQFERAFSDDPVFRRWDGKAPR